MRKLLLNRKIAFLTAISFLFCFFSCCSNQKVSESKSNHENIEKNMPNSVVKGDSLKSQQTNIKGTSKDSINRAAMIKNNSPNQREEDSLKQAKLKGKK